MGEIAAYKEASVSGQYQKPGGLLGKYDNVRRFWEDEGLGFFLSPYLQGLLFRSRENGERLRVLDLGCGSGDGFEFLTGINDSKSLISEHKTKLIEPDMLGLYKGLDINEGLLEQARVTYGKRYNTEFVRTDLNDFDFSAEEPYDLYLANYGTLSHNTDEQTVELFGKIARQGKDGAIIVVDWLGRYSYEWQTLWANDFKHSQWIDYTISYIYSDGDSRGRQLTYFPLRIMGRQEVRDIYSRVQERFGEVFTLQKLVDRSSLVGRHMDTAQYNPHCQPLRQLVNSLFEPNQCTDLDELLVSYVPVDGFTEVNAYYQKLTDWWNYLITYTQVIMEQSTLPEYPTKIPAVVRAARSVMKRVVRAATGTAIGNSRASIIEPQLGYCLRELEMGFQRGLGCGHGLVGIFKVVK